jgi:apolipoprotein N-acyltransferase
VIVFARELLPAKASGRKRVSQSWTDKRWRNPLLILVAVLAYILAFQSLGFILSSTLLLIGLFLVLKPVRFWRDLLIAVVGSVATFAIFDLWLKVTLPHQLPEQLLISLRNLL